MKFTSLIILISLIPTLGWSKIDFNEAISESASQQHTLSASSRKSEKQVRAAASSPRERIVVVEKKGQSYAAPSSAGLTKYDKETQAYAASGKAQMNRLANEINLSK